jgi:hypothetical protein
MNFIIVQTWYYIGVQPVTIVAKNLFDSLTYIETTQAELNAARVHPDAEWGDAELVAIAQAKLPVMFPSLTDITVSLYEEPPIEVS